MRARDLLLEARRVFVEEGRELSKHGSGRDRDDAPIPLSALERAPKLSITGAIYLAAMRKGVPLSHGLVTTAVTVARDAIGLKSTGGPFADLADFNDADPVTLREVVIVLSRACGLKPIPKPEEKKPSPEQKDPSYSIALGAGAKTEGEMGSVSAKIAALEPDLPTGLPELEIVSFSPELGELVIALPADDPKAAIADFSRPVALPDDLPKELPE